MQHSYYSSRLILLELTHYKYTFSCRKFMFDRFNFLAVSERLIQFSQHFSHRFIQVFFRAFLFAHNKLRIFLLDPCFSTFWACSVLSTSECWACAKFWWHPAAPSRGCRGWRAGTRPPGHRGTQPCTPAWRVSPTSRRPRLRSTPAGTGTGNLSWSGRWMRLLRAGRLSSAAVRSACSRSAGSRSRWRWRGSRYRCPPQSRRNLVEGRARGAGTQGAYPARRGAWWREGDRRRAEV